MEAFLLYLFGGKEDDELSSRNSRYQHSLAQDLIYTVTGGRVKTPKSLLLPSFVKALTNNTEIITILNRLGHGVSYSILSEMLTESAHKVAEQQTDGDVILPEATAKEQFTIYVADHIDRAEETLMERPTKLTILSSRTYRDNFKRLAEVNLLVLKENVGDDLLNHMYRHQNLIIVIQSA